MAKRFTDSEKWERPWFADLDLKAKLTWIYLVDKCDHRGVWFGNFKLMSFELGFKVSPENLREWFGSKIRVFDEDKYFIKSFVDFQYKELNPNNNAHKSVIELIEKLGPHEDLGSPCPGAHRGAQDKEEDKDKDKVNVFEGGVGETLTPQDLQIFWNMNRKSLPEATVLNAERLKHAKAQLTKYPSLDHWSKALAKFTSSQFCLVDWKPCFDDFLSESKRTKAIEGYYDRKVEPINRGPPKRPEPKPVNQSSQQEPPNRVLTPEEKAAYLKTLMRGKAI